MLEVLIKRVKCYFITDKCYLKCDFITYKCYLKCYFITYNMLFIYNYVIYNSTFFLFIILLHICLPLDQRLNATLHKKLHALILNDVACVEKCVDDTCCRSVNFLKTPRLDGKKNGDNCELFHDAVLTAESYSLSQNDNYDHFTLSRPLKVSLHNSFTEI